MVKQSTKKTKGCVIRETDDKLVMYHDKDMRIIYIRSKNPEHNMLYDQPGLAEQIRQIFSIKNLRNNLAGILVAGLIISFLYLVLRVLGVINGW